MVYEYSSMTLFNCILIIWDCMCVILKWKLIKSFEGQNDFYKTSISKTLGVKI
jgi:hypothetical protein